MKSRMISVFLAMVMALSGLQDAVADYLAYSVGEKDKAPLPERLDKIETKYLLNIEWGDYAGRKARLGVLEVDNNSSSSSFTVTSSLGEVNYSDSTTGVPVNGIEAIVIDSLAQSGRFRLVERTELGSVLGEQDLAASGRIAKPSGAETGNVLGAEFLVQLVITDYETKTSGTDKGVGGLVFSKIPLLGGVKGGSSTGRVGLNIRLNTWRCLERKLLDVKRVRSGGQDRQEVEFSDVWHGEFPNDTGPLKGHLDLQTAYQGGLYGIDPYDQPGVEAGKIAAFALIGREGFEAERAAIDASAPGSWRV